MSIKDDLKDLTAKYGDKKGIPTADRIMRVVRWAEEKIEKEKKKNG